MLFSIILCVNKDDGYLHEAIKSILEQTYEEYELIIVLNNCSDDLEISVQKYITDRVRVFRTSIGQLSFNLNYGIDLAIGEYIVRMDSDDICHLSRLEVLRKSIISNNYPDVIGSCANLIDVNGDIIGEFLVPLKSSEIKSNLYRKNTIIHPSVAIKKSTILNFGGYLGGFNSEDYDLWLRMSRDNDVTFINVPDKLLKYRISDTQSKGSRLAYSEVSGHLLKEFLLRNKIKYLLGTFISVAKVYINAR